MLCFLIAMQKLLIICNNEHVVETLDILREQKIILQTHLKQLKMGENLDKMSAT